jgi:hypothetical protein
MGMTKIRGGKGVTWMCGCGQSSKDNPCIHLKCLWSYAKHNKLINLLDAEIISLTKRGKNYFLREHPAMTIVTKPIKKVVARKIPTKKPKKRAKSMKAPLWQGPKRYAKCGIGGFGS